ncbi:MAG: glycine--tRNA ligase subunit beta, partial [bacterium]
LTETMVAHQKYFPVEDEQTGDLKACFIGVRNGGEEGLDTVIKGNERVIRARLNDAVFFYNKDLEREFESYRKDLEGVIFQEELGSLYDKTERLAHLADKLEEVPGQLVEIARHCKNDQVTEIVGEFPSLQGTMGAIYATNSGWPEESARVIEEHYFPRDRDDKLPSTSPGRWLSLLDRVDTLVGFFNLGSRPTGSADPYGLRRDAISLLRVITAGEIKIDLEKLIEQAASQYESAGIEVSSEALADLEEFIVDRFYNWYRSEEGWSDELVGAVLDKFWNRPLLLEQRLEWLAGWKKSEDFIAVVEAARRIYNIAGKQSGDDIDPNLFDKAIEGELLEMAKKSEENIDEALESEAPERVLGELKKLSSVVHEYFEEVMVMVEDQEIKNNRLATLTRVHEVYDRIANFSNFEV